MALTDYDTDPDANILINSIDIDEDCAAANVNNAIRQVMADLASWLVTATIQALELTGNLLFSGSTPTVTFNSGGPRLRSGGTNRLSIYTDSNDRARMSFASGGQVMVGGARNVTGAEDLQGSGNLRVYAATAGGYAVTAYDTQDYTAFQLVRDVSGSPEQKGTITVSTSGTAYNTTSDERLKTNFRDFDSGLILDSLWVGEFDWKAGGIGYGVRAQQAYEVFPDAIHVGDDERPWEADYSKFVPILLNEVKALRQRIAELESA